MSLTCPLPSRGAVGAASGPLGPVTHLTVNRTTHGVAVLRLLACTWHSFGTLQALPYFIPQAVCCFGVGCQPPTLSKALRCHYNDCSCNTSERTATDSLRSLGLGQLWVDRRFACATATLHRSLHHKGPSPCKDSCFMLKIC